VNRVASVAEPGTADPVLRALRPLMPAGVTRGEVRRDGRVIRWVESGRGEPVVVLDAAAAEPGSLAWAAVMPLVAARTRVVAYDRAGAGVSDPVTPLTLDSQTGDLTAVLQATGGGRPVVVAGHSWGGLLAQLAALDHPELVAGLVLADPADENYLDPPAEGLKEGLALGEQVLALHDSNELAGTVREAFGPYARRLTGDPQVQELILDAYARSYEKRTQAAMIRDEHQLIADSLTTIQQRRAESPPLAMPVILFSATTGQPQPDRERYTAHHAALIATLPAAQHVVLPETTHAMNQERPAELAEAIISLLGRP
jgi:pimeloyl-ACP methyl ester carboxylesterase